MLFRNPEDEDRLCRVLKAYVEEWGPERVFVSVPAHWSSYSNPTLGAVRLKFETGQSVAVGVEYDNMVILRFELPFFPEVSSVEKARFPTGQSLENRLFRVALRHLMKQGGQKEDAVSNVISAYIGKLQAVVPLHVFELEFGYLKPNEIAYVMIYFLVSEGLIKDIHHTLLLTERGRRWLKLHRSRR